ncbi:MAG: cysteine desulfurase family protein [bacterium]|nr:cysteine desulfurase family protein [bacterium]
MIHYICSYLKLILYFDHAATTPIHPEVMELVKLYSETHFGNASSLHSYGAKARLAVDQAFHAMAGILNCDAHQIVSTSGGTESNNLVLRGISEKNGFQGHIITSSVEHHSVLHCCERLEELGMRVTYLPVNRDGLIDPNSVQKAITDETLLVSIMMANNEIGTLQPISEISQITKERGVLFHTDAVQAGGSLDCDVERLGVDFLSLSGHKFYGPKGVGLLYMRSARQISPQIIGGAHQSGLRGGTLNTPGIVGMAKALSLAQEHRETENARLIGLRDQLIQDIQKHISGAFLCGHPTQRLPNNAHFCFEKIDGESLLMRLNNRGIAVSSGSACTAGQTDISHVVAALGLPEQIAQGAIRISLGKNNTDTEVSELLVALREEIEAMRGL